MWFLTLFSVMAGAAEVHVPGDHPTVQQAVDASAPGDVIVVDGTSYVSEVAANQAIVVPHDLTIRGVGATPQIPAINTENTNLHLENLTLVAMFTKKDFRWPCRIGLRTENLATVSLERVSFVAPHDGSDSMAILADDSIIQGADLVSHDLRCVAPFLFRTSEAELNGVEVTATGTPVDTKLPQIGAVGAVESEVHLTGLNTRGIYAWQAIVGAERSELYLRNSSLSETQIIGEHDYNAHATVYFEQSVGEIIGSKFTGNQSPNGTVLVVKSDSLTIHDSHFMSNVGGITTDHAVAHGSGDLTVRDSSNVAIFGSTFSSSIGTAAASLLAEGSLVNIEDSIFSDHSLPHPATSASASPLAILHGSLAFLHKTSITHGRAHYGGAITISGSDLHMLDGELAHNSASVGGALYVDRGADVILEGVLLELNAAESSGGQVAINSNVLAVYADDTEDRFSPSQIISSGASFTATGSRFDSGEAPYGGAIYSFGGNLILIDQSVIEKHTSEQGTLQFGPLDLVEITRSDLRYNTADVGAFAVGTGVDDLNLSCNRICGNESSDYLAAFTQDYAAKAWFTMQNNAWYDNQVSESSSSDPGASVGTVGLALSYLEVDAALRNNTFVGDLVNNQLYLSVPESLEITNNLFHVNGTAIRLSGQAGGQIAYNLYEVSNATHPAGLEGDFPIYGAADFQSYVPNLGCDQNLWLEASSLGYQQGDPSIHDLSDAEGLYPSSVGAYGGPLACLNDNDGDGVYEDMDCDDNDPNNYPGNTEVCDGQDNTCNGLIDDEDPEWDGEDGTIWYLDLDDDGYGDPETATPFCGDPGEGWVTNGDDCDDTDEHVNPDAEEVCDTIDNNCSGLIDDEDPELVGAPAWYLDGDEDGFGAGDPVFACVPSANEGPWVANDEDCDDDDPDVNPDAIEVCDGIDNNCNDLIDDEDPAIDLTDGTDWFFDDDGDGFGAGDPTRACAAPGEDWTPMDGDCDDSDPDVNPDATEVCDGIDNNCNNLIDDEDPGWDGEDGEIWYQDGDGDGFGDPQTAAPFCGDPGDGWVDVGGDCDDGNNLVHPNADEICDNIDNNCNDLIDDQDPALIGAPAWYLDEDEDGFGAGDPVFACVPSANEGPWVANDEDCDDDDPDVNPDAIEVCDGIDNNCNDLIDDEDPEIDLTDGTDWFFDNDGDGFGAGDPTLACEPPGADWTGVDGDCDDSDPSVHPEALEICDGIDNNCDGLIDDEDPEVDLSTARDWYLDADEDGFGVGDPVASCSPPEDGGPWALADGDCDDGDPLVNPDAAEICDGIDNNCSGLIDDEDPALDLSSTTTWYEDLDQDGFGAGQGTPSCLPPTDDSAWVENGDDCDDSDTQVHPDATEVCDGIDNNCNGLIDDEDPALDTSTATTWYPDTDQDGVGVEEGAVLACEPPAPTGWSDVAGDCDDTDPTLIDVCELESWIQGGCNGCSGTGNTSLSWLVVLGGLVALRRRRSA